MVAPTLAVMVVAERLVVVMKLCAKERRKTIKYLLFCFCF